MHQHVPHPLQQQDEKRPCISLSGKDKQFELILRTLQGEHNSAWSRAGGGVVGERIPKEVSLSRDSLRSKVSMSEKKGYGAQPRKGAQSRNTSESFLFNIPVQTYLPTEFFIVLFVLLLFSI